MNNIWLNAVRASGSFAPSQISGLVFDHDCDLIPGSDGDAIAAHTFAVAFSQATAGKRPVLKKAANGINGHNVLRFSGAQAWRSTAAIDLSGTNGVTIFTVANVTGAAATRILYEFGTTLFTVGALDINFSSANVCQFAANGNVGFSTFNASGTPVGTNLCYSGVHDFSLSTDETTGWINGASSGSRSANSNNTVNFGNYVLFVGARNESSFYITADIARIILYNRALSSTERGQVEAYLSSLYALGF